MEIIDLILKDTINDKTLILYFLSNILKCLSEILLKIVV